MPDPIDHGNMLGKNGQNLGYIDPAAESKAFRDGTFNRTKNQFMLAAGYCKCQPLPLPEWQKGYLETKTGPFVEIDIGNVLTSSSNKPARHS